MTDRTILATREYADPGRLDARHALYRCRRPPLDLAAEAARLLHDTPGPVLDVGCGPGRYLAALRADRPHRPAFGIDLSPGMLAAAGGPAVTADAAALPVRDGACGTVLAMHMLYHVPEPEAALAEFARVRAPSGTVLIATNATGDKQQMHTLYAEVMHELTGGRAHQDVSSRFSLEDGQRLARRHFTSVERIDFPGTIEVPSPEPVLAWLASLTGPDQTEAIHDEIRARIAGIIAREGAFRFGTHTGFLLCR